MTTTPVFIGLGSNLDNPVTRIREAVEQLRRLSESHLTAISPLYQSVPVGPAGQPDFINAVAALETTLTPQVLLGKLQQLETRLGRQRTGIRWGPRVIDMDILLYGTRVIDQPDLKIPHPQMVHRNFVLYPLADIAPDLLIPGLGPLQALLPSRPATDIKRIEPA